MCTLRSMTATLFLLAVPIAAPFSAHAAESYDNCAGFIDSLPATISTQGVWCLRHDLSTSIASGSAINITADDVTIDCNDFKLGGLAAGYGTQANGIFAFARRHETVRHCNIRGFARGVSLAGYGIIGGETGGGHVVEDNRLDANTYIGLAVEGDDSVVRRNEVTDTGSSSYSRDVVYGIYTFGAVDVLDNTVGGVLPLGDVYNGNGDAIGIWTVSNSTGSLDGNRVRGLVSSGTGVAKGIYNAGNGRISLDGNRVIHEGSGGLGLFCEASTGYATRNTVIGFATGISTCGNSGNVIH